MEDFDDVLERALEPYPLYRRLVEMKIDGYQNIEIQEALEKRTKNKNKRNRIKYKSVKDRYRRRCWSN